MDQSRGICVVLRSLLVACAVALALPARAAPSHPPFSPEDSPATKILKLIDWLGSIDDLSASPEMLPDALGLSRSSKDQFCIWDGKSVKYATQYISDAPAWHSAQVKIEYSVMEPFDWLNSRARVMIYGIPSDVCFSAPDLIAHFGPNPNIATEYGRTHSIVIGQMYVWTLREAPQINKLYASFPPHGKGCARTFWISESR